MSSVTPSNLSATVLPRTSAISKGLLIFGGALFLAALAQVAIPVPGSPVPVTGQTLGVLLLATAYGANLGASTFTLYLLIGLAGAPVFANQGHGLERLIGPTGGYLVGMLIASWVLGALAGRKWDQRFLSAITIFRISPKINGVSPAPNVQAQSLPVYSCNQISPKVKMMILPINIVVIADKKR